MSKACAALFVLLALFVVARGERSLKAVEKPGAWFQCSALSVLKIQVFHGSCRGIAAANCRAVAISFSQTKAAFKVFSSQKACNFVALQASAKAIGVAIAKTWASALVRIQCNGAGWGCGFAFSNAEAWASAFAKAIALAAADAASEKFKGFCVADVEALSVVFAQAASRAKAVACQKNSGSASDFEKSFAEAISIAIAKAFAKAIAYACDKANAGGSLCFGEGSSGSSGSNNNGGNGSSSSGQGQMKPCGVLGGGPCCVPKYRGSMCFDCPGCKTGKHWRLKTANGPGGLKIWMLSDGSQCFCAKE